MSVEITQLAIGPARATVAVPSKPTGVGVLLYPTIFGVNPPMLGFAGELAALGMTVIVWDPYRGEPLGSSVPEVVERSKRCEDDAAIEDLVTLCDHARTEMGVIAVGGVGWCFGGRIGLLHAGLDHRVTALCTYNPTMLSVTPVAVAGVGVISRADSPGQTMDEFAHARRIVGAVQMTRPEHDFTQPSEYDALRDALFARADPTFYEYYPATDHGFSYMPGPANERSHHLAWSRTLSLLAGLSG